MKFGKAVQGQDIERGELPPDDPLTPEVLGQKPATECKIYVALPQWGADGYRGVIFPESTPAKSYLPLYANHFNSVELNATGYRIPPITQVEQWISKVPRGFMFVPKVPQPITQNRPLGKNHERLHEWDKALEAFGSHLGAVLLSMDQRFVPARHRELTDFLAQWQNRNGVHVELRNADWFKNTEILRPFFVALRALGVGTVITDAPARQDAVHQTLTTRTAYIRFSDSSAIPTRKDFERLSMWAERIADWKHRGLERAFFVCHATDDAQAPILCDHFIQEVNRAAGTSIARPALLHA